MEKEFISVRETCERFSVGRTKLNDLMREGAITRHKIGRKTLIDPKQVRSVIVEGKTASTVLEVAP